MGLVLDKIAAISLDATVPVPVGAFIGIAQDVFEVWPCGTPVRQITHCPLPGPPGAPRKRLNARTTRGSKKKAQYEKSLIKKSRKVKRRLLFLTRPTPLPPAVLLG